MKMSKHGMTTEQAIEKKKIGHSFEKIFANLIKGYVVKGNGKTDVKDEYGNTYSLKTGKKTQWLLITEKSICNEFDKYNIPLPEICEYFDFLPTKIIYLENKQKYSKNDKAEKLSKIVEVYLKDIVNIFMSKSGEVTKLVFYDDRQNVKDGFDNGFFIFDMSESIDFLVKIVSLVYFTPGGKVVIKGPKTQLFELELRKGVNHKTLLIHSHTKRILDLLKNNINFEVI
jgi:hypothetical protein